MVPDDKGSKDKSTVLFTKEPIDYDTRQSKRFLQTQGNGYENEKRIWFKPNQNTTFSGSKTMNSVLLIRICGQFTLL
jgi:hypothetical protein